MLTLKAAALTRLERYDDAGATLDDARVHVYSTPSASLEAEFEFHQASLSFALGDDAGAAEAARRALVAKQAAWAPTDHHFVPLAVNRARAREVLAAVAALDADYGSQARELRSALEEIEVPETRDEWLRASILANLSFLVRDLDLAPEWALLRERHAGIAVTPETASFRYWIAQSLGWGDALRGDYLGAFRHLRAAAEVAPSQALKLAAKLDRAFLARELGETMTSRDEVEHAEEMAARIDWSLTTADERFALLSLAQALAETAPERARRVLEAYKATKGRTSALHLAARDRRRRADEVYTEGLVSLAEGGANRAVLQLQEAFEIWNEVGYRWKAARAALELARLDTSRFFATYAAGEAAKHPGSWLAARSKALAAQ